MTPREECIRRGCRRPRYNRRGEARLVEGAEAGRRVGLGRRAKRVGCRGGSGGARRAWAIASAAEGKEMSSESPMAQPIKRRLHRSSTPATYSQPSSVGMQVMSVTQIWSEPVGELVGRDRLVVATVRGDDAEAAARAALGAPRPRINIPARRTIWGDPANENDHPITLYARPWRYPRIPLLGGSGSMPSYPALAVARPRRAIARSPRWHISSTGAPDPSADGLRAPVWLPFDLFMLSWPPPAPLTTAPPTRRFLRQVLRLPSSETPVGYTSTQVILCPQVKASIHCTVSTRFVSWLASDQGGAT